MDQVEVNTGNADAFFFKPSRCLLIEYQSFGRGVFRVKFGVHQCRLAALLSLYQLKLQNYNSPDMRAGLAYLGAVLP